MAERRMIHRNVVCSDAFIEMSFQAQALYYQLQIEGDEWGFVAGLKRIMRTIGASEEAVEELVKAGFVYRFDSGILLMRHWDVANTRKSDRENAIAFTEEYEMVEQDKNKVYHWKRLES